MEVYEMMTAPNGVKLGATEDNIFYIAYPGGCWNEIPANNLKEAEKFFEDEVANFN